MKKIFLFLISIYSLHTTFAQNSMYFGLGYNASLLKADDLDFVINIYNDTRGYLDKTMSTPHYMDGFTTHLGIGLNFLLIDFGFTGRSSKISASGVDFSGKEQQRDVKIKYHSFDLGLGAIVAKETDFSFALGVNLNIGNEKSETRAGNADAISDIDYTEIEKQFGFAYEPFIQFVLAPTENLAFIIQPYYHANLHEMNYAPLNYAINPATASGDPNVLNGLLKGFGIKLMMGSYTLMD